MTTRQANNLFRKLYYDPRQPTAFTSVQKVLAAAKKTLKSVNKKQVTEFFKKEKPYVLHKRKNRKFLRSKIFSPRKNHLWESDLTEVQKLKKNK